MIRKRLWVAQTDVDRPGLSGVRWIMELLHDPKYLIHLELEYHRIRTSCRIFSINSSIGSRHFGSGFRLVGLGLGVLNSHPLT